MLNKNHVSPVIKLTNIIYLLPQIETVEAKKFFAFLWHFFHAQCWMSYDIMIHVFLVEPVNTDNLQTENEMEMCSTKIK